MIPLNEGPQIKYWNELTWAARWTCLRHQTGFYFIFIPFYLGEWCDRRIFTDFWILHKLDMAEMALQSLSSKQTLPSNSPVRDFTQNWSKLGIIVSKLWGIQECLIEYRYGVYHVRSKVYSKIFVLECLTFICLYEPNDKDKRKRERKKNTNRY